MYKIILHTKLGMKIHLSCSRFWFEDGKFSYQTGKIILDEFETRKLEYIEISQEIKSVEILTDHAYG